MGSLTNYKTDLNIHPAVVKIDHHYSAISTHSLYFFYPLVCSLKSLIHKCSLKIIHIKIEITS